MIDGIPFPHIGQTARFSLDGQYRYELTRRWAHGPVACWIMLNPSTADAKTDDATIRRCTRFTKEWNLSGLVVVNLFAHCATNPSELAHVIDPVGPQNDEAIHDAAVRARVIVAAWGANAVHIDRPVEVLSALQMFALTPVMCLGQTKRGHPCHPLRLAKATQLQPLSP